MKNKKAFTLIELLAVIVILGLLMAIAIPSITKYITQSRKKTYVANAQSYISATSNSINNMEYTFTDTNATYYVSVDCISLDKGGQSPFGKWEEAYVVVTYDDLDNTYKYYWYSKDSAGYGVDLVEQNDLTPDSVKIVDEKFYIREADDKTGDVYIVDNDSTCKPKKTSVDVPTEERSTMIKIDKTKYFWQFKEQIKNIYFEKKVNVPEDVYQSWDLSTTKDGRLMAYLKENENDSNYYDLYIQGNRKIYLSGNCDGFFQDFTNVDKIENIDILDTKGVTNMSNMFRNTGYNSKIFTLKLGSAFDTSSVTSMTYMFYKTGYSSSEFELDLGKKFDTNKVKGMTMMFYYAGASSNKMKLDLGDKFNTQNVTAMGSMFYGVGINSPVFTLNLGEKFDTSNVTEMSQLFCHTGESSPYMNLNLGDKFYTSKVTSMYELFAHTGKGNPNFELNLGNHFDISNVTNMDRTFYANKSKEIYLNYSSFNPNLNAPYLFTQASEKTVYVKTQEDKNLLDSLGYKNINVVVK